VTDLTDSKLKGNHTFFIIGSIALFLFLIESIIVFNHLFDSSQVDRLLIAQIQSGISRMNTSLMISMTQLGSPLTIILLSVLMTLFLVNIKKYAAAIWSVSTLIIGAAVVNPLLKLLFGRPRPLIHRIITEAGYSYPSGHAIGATLFYGSLIILVSFYIHKRSLQLVIILFAGTAILLVMLSRVYLGVHYPSDVLAGFLAGTVVDCYSVGIFLLFSSSHHSARSTFFSHRHVETSPVDDQDKIRASR
jgi:Membrane-associated phospholipid phosphatase